MRYVPRIILMLAAVYTTYAHAQSKEYNWKYLHMVDADTLLFEALWSPLDNKTISVRLYGLDAPESFRPKCKEEFELALKAKAYVKKTLDNATHISVTPISWDKYGGRILARVTVNNEDLSVKILKAGLAREYHGGHKNGWC